MFSPTITRRSGVLVLLHRRHNQHFRQYPYNYSYTYGFLANTSIRMSKRRDSTIGGVERKKRRVGVDSGTATSTPVAAPKEKHGGEEDDSQHGAILRKYYPKEISTSRAEEYNSGTREKPIETLLSALSAATTTTSSGEGGGRGRCVAHWFRGDLRVHDNTALSLASREAGEGGLVGLYIVSPQDWEAHVVSPAKVDFILRSLRVLRGDLEELGIPLHIEVVPRRGKVASRVLQLCVEWDVRNMFANMEYEVDELRRDAEIVERGAEAGVAFRVVHDLCVVPPGELLTKSKGTPYAVYTPWFRAWIEHVHARPDMLELSPLPRKNPGWIRRTHASLFDSPIPSAPPGKTLESREQEEYLAGLYPAGEHAARSRLEEFLEERVKRYDERRNGLADGGTSMLSMHFASGTLSARQAVRAAREANSTKALNGGNKGIQTWISEVAWRDFYKHVLVNWPFVCMSKPFKLPYSNISWPNTPTSESHFKAWTTGNTGYPIIDAAMRQLVQTKHMHNRARMIVASFLTKDLLIDWRRGERFFLEHLVDGDFASNNGGWGWCAGTGVDPQPYFRVFNPVTQSTRFDPSGQYIRTWVRELSGLDGKALHTPWEAFGEEEFASLGYARPIVVHEVARTRYLEVYKEATVRQGEK